MKEQIRIRLDKGLMKETDSLCREISIMPFAAVKIDALIEELNRGYVCPPDASPAWQAACEYGFDMSLVEEALKRTPEERLDAHQRVLDMILDLKETPNDAK
jgi:hypothetical protein